VSAALVNRYAIVHAPYYNVICGPSVSIILYYSTVFYSISITVKFSKKKITEHKMCVLMSSTNLSQTFVILRRTERDMMRNVYRSSCKVFVIVVSF